MRPNDGEIEFVGLQDVACDALNVVGGDGAGGGQVVVDLPPVAGDFVLSEEHALVEEGVLRQDEGRLDAVAGFL